MMDASDTPKYSDPFRNMAASIDHNESAHNFGGAVVIVPPLLGGEPIEILMLDASRDPATFWGTIQTRIGLAMQDLQAKQNVRGGFSR